MSRVPVKDRVMRVIVGQDEIYNALREHMEAIVRDHELRGMGKRVQAAQRQARTDKKTFTYGSKPPLPRDPLMDLPWYSRTLKDGLPWRMELGLPKLNAHMATGEEGSPAWPHAKGATNGALSITRSALSFLATVLYTRHGCTRLGGGAGITGWYCMDERAFDMTPRDGRCMMVDPRKIVKVNREHRSVRLLFYEDRAYLRVRLTMSKGRPMYEYAHRIVHWAMTGPPPAHLVDPVAMHTCHNGKCLNPRHMKWGERVVNLLDR